MKKGFGAILFFLHASLVQAQEVSVFLGEMLQPRTHDNALAAQIEYKQVETTAFAWSLSYLNEGHFPNHHRDGYLGQLWLGTGSGVPGFSLAVGVGPHYYFDTVSSVSNGYSNDHGWGLIASIAAGWQTAGNWLFQVRSNWVEAGRSIDRVSVMAGIGYRLPSLTDSQRKLQYPQETARNNQISLFAGQSIVNSFQSEPATAVSLEYRRTFLPYLEGTLSWLYEGHNSALTRNGFCAEIWAAGKFFNDRLGLGVGAGPYRAVDLDMPDRTNSSYFSLILSATSSYRFEQRWNMRVIFHRIVTSYDKDSDVILGGVGYAF